MSKFIFTFLKIRMSKYLGPKLKLFLRLGFLHGFNNSTKCFKKQNDKKPNTKKQTVLPTKEYTKILIKNQKIRFLYGITKNKLKNLSNQSKQTIFSLLESRLDCILFRLGFTKSIASARQLILHKHIAVNKKLITYPGYLCKKSDTVSPLPFSQHSTVIKQNFNNFQLKKSLKLERAKIFDETKALNIDFFPKFWKANSEIKLFPQLCTIPKIGFIEKIYS